MSRIKEYSRVIFLFLSVEGIAQTAGPVARFSFNDRADHDELSGNKAKLVGVNFTYDRFENKDHAVYFHGNAASYVNLGSYAALKPEHGSISLWVKIDAEIWSGAGRYMNPVIITKNAPVSNFNEAYYICYFPDMNKAAAICSQDSLDQVLIVSVENFELFGWHHLALTFDNRFMCFYIDGKLEHRLPKTFETQYLEGDSVMLGVTASRKNNRFLLGAVDDVLFYDRVLSPQEVEELYNAPNPNKRRIILNWVLLFLAFVTLVAGISVLIRRRMQLALKKEKERMELYNIILGTELRVNRALMNPHFVFNSMNALHNFILAKENDLASEYLIKFSKLIRKMLESNIEDSITLELEIELLTGYLEIESLRFEEDIRYDIEVDDALVPSAIRIPVMLLQPFVENAIWHGLLNKPGEKTVTVSFSAQGARHLCCIIEDNGTGREMDPERFEKKPRATDFVRHRLELLSRIHNLQCSLEIIDKPGRSGTIVKIILPILNH